MSVRKRSGGAIAPGGAPVVVTPQRAGDLFEIGEHDTVGDEARSPMGDGGIQSGVGRALLNARDRKRHSQAPKIDFSSNLYKS